MTVSLGSKWWPVACWRQVLPGNCSRSRSSSKQTHLETSSRASSSNSTESLLERKSGKKCVQVGGLFKSMSRFLQLLDDNWFHRTLLNKWLCNRNNWNIGSDNHLSNVDSWRETQLEDGFQKYLSQSLKIFVWKFKNICQEIKNNLSKVDSCPGNTIGRWLSGISRDVRLDESDKQFHQTCCFSKQR